MSIENKNGFLLNEEKNVPIYINETQYYVSSNFSIYHGELYTKALNDSNDAKMAISHVIYEKLKSSGYDNITINDIQNEKEDIFLDFINAVVSEDSQLSDIYSKENDSLPILQRFSISYSKYCEYNVKAISNSPAIQALQQMNESMKASTNFQTIQAAQQQLDELMRPVTNSPAIQDLQKAVISMKAIFAPIQDNINRYTNIITDVLSNVNIPTIPEKRKKELIESHKKWGSYGWTLLPHAHIKLFDTCPDNCMEADKIALAYCNKSYMENLFSELRIMRVKKTDLEEAIFCFNNRQYKACSLVLFGIIDSKLIKLQPKSTNEKRKVGFGAIIKSKEQIESESDIKDMLFFAFQHFNLFKCLSTFFNATNDFKTEPNTINRNFVGHGMNRRQVRKKDCIKLFLAIYNLSDFLDSYNIINQRIF